jgi:hypothetical protein
MGFLSAFQRRPLTDPAQFVEKFSGLLTCYLEKTARSATLCNSPITLIARSPSMAAARALILHASEIRRQQIGVHIVFAKLAPIDQLAQLSAALQLVDPRNPRVGKIRFIRNSALLDAHEQLVLGRELCWTGDMLRRCDEHRNGLDIVEEGQPGPIRLAELSFSAMWAAAKPVPGRALNGHPLAPAFASAKPTFGVSGLPGSEKAPALVPGAPTLTRH